MIHQLLQGVHQMTSSEIVLSILAAVITSLIGVIVAMLRASQSRFEERMEKHVHDLRDDVHNCSNQILVLKTVLTLQLPKEVQERIEGLSTFRRDS